MDQLDEKLIALLQGSIPLVEDPYEDMAQQLGVTPETVVERLKALHAGGQLKRIGAILRHQKSGYTENAMVVFQVADHCLEEAARALTQSPLVSHCYQRSSHAAWPYNLYAMLHSRSSDEIDSFVEVFTTAHGITAYESLYSLEELKKSSMVYF